MRWLIVILALAGCYSPRGTRCEPCSGVAECPGGLACLSGTCQDRVGECSPRDGDTEAMPDSPMPCVGVNAPPFVEICAMTVRPGTFDLPATISTQVGSPDCAEALDPAPATEDSICVVAADRIVGQAPKMRIEGSRPIVLYARESVRITGKLDLAGHNNDIETAVPAAGANMCKEPSPASGNTAANGAGAGGAGATFRGRGGRGGNGVGATGVVASATLNLGGRLQGGCRASEGGIGETTSAGGLGGNGGGAIYILAPLVEISGTINASGGGARLGPVSGGGGGGGSGGMILLWAPDSNHLVIGPNARIFALGGGGGSGGSSLQNNVLANAGDDPGGPADFATATTTTGNGGRGGNGGTATNFSGGSTAVDGTATGGAGGGGGGSTGFIRMIPMIATTAATVAPPPLN